MKTPRKAKPASKANGKMRSEYRLDYRKARRNRFAKRLTGRTIAIVLDPDVAAVFTSSESVNSLLRSVISVLPVQEQ